ncbi:MAG TPA: CDP-glucose 4,6-dehydratase [Steroidobacteraceae bacterium]
MATFWQNRRVFLTGHTGFKGAWMNLWLQHLGAKVTGYALAPHTEPSMFALVNGDGISHIADIRESGKVRDAVIAADPQVVIHMAAQALVRESYRDPLATYATNVLGTGSVLQACRALQQLQCVLVVTSDKVYENRGEGRPFVEGDRLGGHDPYSNSKACAELLTVSFRDSFFSDAAPIATARAGNVIGGGDWSQDRLIPDCVRALKAGEAVSLRYPDAIRPWQHVLEPLSGYLALAEALVQAPAAAPRAVNFGPDASSFCTVREVVERFSRSFSGRPGWRRDTSAHPMEAGALTLSSALAGNSLGWRPRLTVDESLAWTADWYRAHATGENMTKYSEAQIVRYQALPTVRS